MEVANPIYDAVFKFLMEDKKSATLLIGAITGFDIEDIESLTHDGAIIQVPALKERRRNRLENVLAIFDQAQINSANHHLLRVDDENQPEECRVLVRRLLQAVSDKQVRQRMVVEDEIISEFEVRDRREQMLSDKALEALQQKEEERQQKEEERRQKEAALTEIEELKRQLKLLDKKS